MVEQRKGGRYPSSHHGQAEENLFLTFYLLVIFRERKGERKREGEKH